tara:strand:- start:385 stop:549 length:165 start_codon:yes stop_codon:yes gene_type:complete
LFFRRITVREERGVSRSKSDDVEETVFRHGSQKELQCILGLIRGGEKKFDEEER